VTAQSHSPRRFGCPVLVILLAIGLAGILWYWAPWEGSGEGSRASEISLVPCVPGMTADLEVRVLSGPGRRDRREAQGRDRKGASEGSVDRNREPTYRNRMRGAADQGELARSSEALAVNETRRKSGGCAVKAGCLTRGDLALRLKGRRHRMVEREVSRRRSRRRESLKARTRKRTRRP